MKTKNILLIGFMAVGKGSLARELARTTNYYVVDSDDLIESFENKKIKKIFREDGEPYFRALEQKTADWLAKHVTQTIISTGGGFFAVENLKKIGTVVFLDSDFQSIYDKIIDHPKAAKKIKKRPLFQNKVQAQELFEKRRPLYADKADITIKTAGKTVQEIAAEIREKLSVE